MRWLILSVLAFLSSSRVIADERSEQAKSLFQEGMAKYHLEKWDAAIDLFERGFEKKPVPEFLFNIAQAQRFAGRPERAIAFYRKYLQLSPNSPMRAEIETNVEKLRSEIDNRSKAEPVTVPKREPIDSPGPAPVAAPPPEHAPEAKPVTTATNQVDATSPRPPLRKRPWFIGVVTLGALLVAGGITAGAVLGTQSAPFRETLPVVRFGP